MCSAGGLAHGVGVVLDTVLHAAFEVTSASQCRATSRVTERPIAAAPTTTGWWFVVRDRAGVAGLQYRRNGSPRADPARPLFPSLGSSPTKWLFLTPFAKGTVVGSRVWPFQWALLDEAGGAVVEADG